LVVASFIFLPDGKVRGLSFTSYLTLPLSKTSALNSSVSYCGFSGSFLFHAASSSLGINFEH
jgi:hypothetical protein